MKSLFTFTVLAVALVTAEPPRYQKVSNHFQRQELAPAVPAADPKPTDSYGPPDESYGPPAAAKEAPYSPSGWTPEGRSFTLPAREVTEPTLNYGPPAETYGAPDKEYGAPWTPNEELPTTENTNAENLDYLPPPAQLRQRQSKLQLKKTDVASFSNTPQRSAKLRFIRQDELPVFLIPPPRFL